MHRGLIAIGLVGCFNPNLDGVYFTCPGDNSTNQCPSGYRCWNKICCNDTDHPCDTDLGTSTPTVDMSVPDLSRFNAYGCFNSFNGRQLRSNVYACPGAFGKNGARQMCAPFWYPCKANRLTADVCLGLTDFFVADVPGIFNNSVQDSTCSTGSGNRTWFGCGPDSPKSETVTSLGCQNFMQAVRCYNTPDIKYWDCFQGEHILDNLINKVNSSGVLCCTDEIG